jgi:hypothetical protein
MTVLLNQQLVTGASGRSVWAEYLRLVVWYQPEEQKHEFVQVFVLGMKDESHSSRRRYCTANSPR